MNHFYYLDYTILDILLGGVNMYYYGGYSGGYGNSCCQPTYCCPSYGGGYGYGGYGYGNNFAIILVLFILLVIIIGSRFSL